MRLSLNEPTPSRIRCGWAEPVPSEVGADSAVQQARFHHHVQPQAGWPAPRSMPRTRILASRARAYGFRTPIACTFKRTNGTNSKPHPLRLGRTVALRSRRRFSSTVGTDCRLRQRAPPRVRRPALLDALNEPGESAIAPLKSVPSRCRKGPCREAAEMTFSVVFFCGKS